MSWLASGTLDYVEKSLLYTREQPHNGAKAVEVIDQHIALVRALKATVPAGKLGIVDSSGHIDGWHAQCKFDFRLVNTL